MKRKVKMVSMAVLALIAIMDLFHYHFRDAEVNLLQVAMLFTAVAVVLIGLFEARANKEE
jgi:uncharacterized membrane protein